MAPWHLKWAGGLILTTETSPRPQMIQVVQEPHLLQTLLLSLLAKLIEDIASLIRQRRKTKKKHNETAPPPRCFTQLSFGESAFQGKPIILNKASMPCSHKMTKPVMMVTEIILEYTNFVDRRFCPADFWLILDRRFSISWTVVFVQPIFG